MYIVNGWRNATCLLEIERLQTFEAHIEDYIADTEEHRDLDEMMNSILWLFGEDMGDFWNMSLTRPPICPKQRRLCVRSSVRYQCVGSAWRATIWGYAQTLMNPESIKRCQKYHKVMSVTPWHQRCSVKWSHFNSHMDVKELSARLRCSPGYFQATSQRSVASDSPVSVFSSKPSKNNTDLWTFFHLDLSLLLLFKMFLFPFVEKPHGEHRISTETRPRASRPAAQAPDSLGSERDCKTEKFAKTHWTDPERTPKKPEYLITRSQPYLQIRW